MDITLNTECKRRLSGSTFPVSKRLAFLALVLWLVALALPGLVFYDRLLFGIEILMLGWLGPWFLNFAWYANPLFLYACLKLILSRKATVLPIIFATLLAVDAFWFRKLLLDEGGSSTDLYGYGFGSLVWLVAILLVLIAAGIRDRELLSQRLSIARIIREPLVFIGSVLLIALVSLFAYWGIGDRLEAGETERRFLSDVVFRVGSVCKLPDVKPLNQIPLVSPLEIADNSIFSPSDLLNWGVPAVRKNGYDYYLRDVSDSTTIVARSAEGPIGAKIEVKHLRQTHGSVMQVRLVSADGRTVGFSGEWNSAPDRHRMCPGYFSFPKPDDPPRSLIMGTLTTESGVRFGDVPRGNDIENNKEYESLIIESIREAGKVHKSKTKNNPGCSAEVELIDINAHGSSSDLYETFTKKLDNPSRLLFRIGEEYHYIGSDRWSQAACNGREVYLLSSSQRNEGDYISMQKRSLPDFNHSWSGIKKIFFRRNEGGLPPDVMEIKVMSIIENDGKLNVRLAYFDKGSETGSIVEIVALVGKK